MKPKQIVVNEKKLSSFESAKNGLRREIKKLQADCTYEVTRLERLRNEIKDIESTQKSLDATRSSFASEKDAFYRDVVIQKGALAALKDECDKKEANALKYLADANDKLKASKGRLVAVEQKEKALDERHNAVQSLLSKAKDLEAQNEKAIKILIEKKNAFDKRLSELEKAEEKVLAEKVKDVQRLKQLNAYRDELEEKNKENTAILNRAHALKAQADAKLLEVKEEAKKSQLSVDRQWNEIEIQKQKLKVQELRIKKLVANKKLHSELKKLESK